MSNSIIAYFYAIVKFHSILFLQKDFLNLKATNISKQVGDTLKYERMRQNISISKIAEALNVNASTIVSVENAKHLASFLLVYEMVNYLKINPSDFFKQISINESTK